MSEQSDRYFSTRLAPDPMRTAVWAHITRYLQRWVPAEGATLDLGAGYADFSRHIRSARRVAFDANPGLATLVPEGVEAVLGTTTDLGAFEDASFDTVMASNLLEHLVWDDLMRCAAEVHRILRPGGRLILVQPNFRLAPRRYFDDYTHRTIFTDRSLADFVQAAGFDVEHAEARFLPLTVKSRLGWGHALVPLYLRLPYRPLAGQMLLVARKGG